MNAEDNPFVAEAATSLSPEQVLDYYIDDHNHARTLRSKKNVFVIGERGSGKSMTLMYHCLNVQRLRYGSDRQSIDPAFFEFAGVLVPANTLRNLRPEHELVQPYPATILSEHVFALDIAYNLAIGLSGHRDLMDLSMAADLREDIQFTTGLELPSGGSFLEGFASAVLREDRRIQRLVNGSIERLPLDETLSFQTLVVPFLRCLRRIPELAGTHFMIMIDDAQYLNEHQIRTLNSLIAYRDHSLFSFKVATVGVGRATRTTSTGGTILEDHDFVTVDLQQPYQSDESSFGKLARKIVTRRLERFGFEVTDPDVFFPTNPELSDGLEQAKERLKARAIAEHPEWTPKQVSDYAYKMHRAEYLRQRGSHSNLPPYSGFKTIVFLSTGVVRNLLVPCHFMYEDAVSEVPVEARATTRLRMIPPKIQTENISRRSDSLWDEVRRLDSDVQGCSHEHCRKIENLLRGLAGYFLDRLMTHDSEPTATSFSISEPTPQVMTELNELFEIAQRARLVYVRAGSHKSVGRRETYYVPNRMLWPKFKLDPYGQNARASIPAQDLLAAANGKPLKYRAATSTKQLDLHLVREEQDD